jgi:hypothetical protein
VNVNRVTHSEWMDNVAILLLIAIELAQVRRLIENRADVRRVAIAPVGNIAAGRASASRGAQLKTAGPNQQLRCTTDIHLERVVSRCPLIIVILVLRAAQGEAGGSDGGCEWRW